MISERGDGASIPLLSRRLAIGLAIWAVFGASSASAGVSFVDMFRSDTFIQTGDGNSLTSTGSYFATHLYSTNANDFDAVRLTYPGAGSPVNLIRQDSTTFGYQTPLFADRASMNVAFPTGTYSFSATGTGAPGSTNFVYPSDAYPASQPYLSGTTYSALQGLNASSAFNFQFSPFVPAPSLDFSFVFLSIFDTKSGDLVYDNGFLPSTTTGVVLAGNTLLSGRQYTYQLIYSDRVLASSPGAAFSAQIGYDLRTVGNFTTAATVPEPASLTLAAQAVLFSAWIFGRRGRRSRLRTRDLRTPL